MASRLNPFIYFGDTARQAMEDYRDVFGGHLAISAFAEFGPADSPDANKVMHAQLETSHRADGEAGVGRRVRFLRRQVRHLVDDQH